MQTLLQRFETGRYLTKEGTWTDDLTRARAFSNRLSARTYRAFHKLSGTQLIPAVDAARTRFVPTSTRRCVTPVQTGKVHGHLEATVELGAGHSIFIRGQGAGLTWNKGTQLIRVDTIRWVWFAECVKEQIIFGLLLDDEIWAKGEKMVLAAGEHLELEPDFDWPEIPRIC